MCKYKYTTFFTENKENYFEIYTYQISCQLSLHLLTSKTANQYLNTCRSIANRLCLHVSYISKLEFMNYLFANLVVAPLYVVHGTPVLIWWIITDTTDCKLYCHRSLQILKPVCYSNNLIIKICKLIYCFISNIWSMIYCIF